MRAKWFLTAILVALALSGCGDSGGNGESEQGREATVLERLAEPDTGPKWDVASRDRSLMARLPAGWGEVSDIDPLALVTLSSGPVAGRIISPCLPGEVLDELPVGGALVRISEDFPSARRGGTVGRRYPPRPKHFRLGHPRPSECGYSYAFAFREGGRDLAVWVWTKPLVAGSGSGIQHGRLGQLSSATSRQLLRLLDGLRVRPAAVEPVRVPFLALDCHQPNTLDCDRVWVQVNTRIRMRRLSVRINRWWAGSADGWVPSGQIMSLPTKLGGTPSDKNPVPGAALPGTVWGGVIRQAGLRGGKPAFERALPVSGEYWVGTGTRADPRIRADLEVISPRGRWDFWNVGLIAGHG